MSKAASKDSAKLFMSGASQAVRLPKKYRFPDGCDEVSVRKVGNALMLSPMDTTWENLFEGIDPISDEFVEAVLDARKPTGVPDAPRVNFDGTAE